MLLLRNLSLHRVYLQVTGLIIVPMARKRGNAGTGDVAGGKSVEERKTEDVEILTTKRKDHLTQPSSTYAACYQNQSDCRPKLTTAEQNERIEQFVQD